jgi:Domain of unknown function (DUF222)
MHEESLPPGPGRDDDPRRVPPWPDWMDDPAYLAARAEDLDLDLCEDPGDVAPPDVAQDELAAEANEIIAAQERAAAVMARLGLTAALAAGAAEGCGRPGPGMSASAESFPGVYASRASGFASGKPLDTAPGCLTLGQFAEEAAGEDDRYPGASDDELEGAIAAWDRVEAYASSRKHAAVAELIRRRPAEGYVPTGPAQMPETCDEFAARELCSVLGESSAAAADMLSLAHELEINLPGTKAAFRAGILNQRKAMIIASATALLDPAEARAAEAMVLGRAGSLTLMRRWPRLGRLTEQFGAKPDPPSAAPPPTRSSAQYSRSGLQSSSSAHKRTGNGSSARSAASPGTRTPARRRRPSPRSRTPCSRSPTRSSRARRPTRSWARTSTPGANHPNTSRPGWNARCKGCTPAAPSPSPSARRRPP